MYAKAGFLFTVLILALLITSCSPSAQNIQGEHWVIFSEKLAKEQGIGSWFAGGENIEYWTPAEEDVLALQSGLSSFLEQNPDRFNSLDKPVWERLDDYNAQYTGIILNGKRVIYANYLCDSAQLEWKDNFVFVADGGDCFFQFQYDVDNVEYFDLQVNGNA